MGATSRTKFGKDQSELDEIDVRIVALVQGDAKLSLARIGEVVDLAPSSVVERVRKLEQSGVIRGYYALIDARKVGLDVTAFIGVSIDSPNSFETFDLEVAKVPEVLECHHVTGAHSLLLKVRTWNTATLETLISRLRSIRGVQRTDTMVVFSTRVERTQVPLGDEADADTDAARGPRRAEARGRENR